LCDVLDDSLLEAQRRVLRVCEEIIENRIAQAAWFLGKGQESGASETYREYAGYMQQSHKSWKELHAKVQTTREQGDRIEVEQLLRALLRGL